MYYIDKLLRIQENLFFTYEFGIVSKESAATGLKSGKCNNVYCYGCNDVSARLTFISGKH